MSFKLEVCFQAFMTLLNVSGSANEMIAWTWSRHHDKARAEGVIGGKFIGEDTDQGVW